MRKILLSFILVLYGLSLFAQEADKRLTFILLIDNEVAANDISDGMFLLQDSTGVVRDKLPFTYHVGSLSMSLADYNKLFGSNKGYKVVLTFIHTEFRPRYSQHTYEKLIPSEWLNEQYIILKVYNRSLSANRSKYVFGKGQQYLIQVKVPGSGSILVTHKGR